MIGPPVFGFAGYTTVLPPGNGFWRVSSWPQVFDPPQPPPPLGASPDDDDGHRYDDPDGRFRTLYCATEAEGALGECLGDFVFNTAAVVRIEAFLESEPEPGFDEDYHRPPPSVRWYRYLFFQPADCTIKTPMTRYKVKAATPEAYRELQSVLGSVKVYTCCPRRRLFSTGKLPADVRHAVEVHGGRIVQDRQYHPEAPQAASG